MDLIKNSINLLTKFDWTNRSLPEFMATHDRLYRDATRTGDYGEVVTAFYTFMTPIIETGYGHSWHFCPTEHAGQSWEDSHASLHQRMASRMTLAPGMTALEMGCGPGETMVDIAKASGAALTGVALNQVEVDRANRLFADRGMAASCQAVRADMTKLPFEPGSFDAAYAIDAFMYLPRIDSGFEEAFRVLKPGGRLMVYGFVRRDGADPEGVIEKIRYSQALPPWPTTAGNLAAATRAGFELAHHENLDDASAFKWYYYFKGHSRLFWWIVTSKMFQASTRVQDRLGLLPKGFAKFDSIYLGGLIRNLVAAGEAGLLSGSELLVFRKPGPTAN